jgi:hypothetical protein
MSYRLAEGPIVTGLSDSLEALVPASDDYTHTRFLCSESSCRLTEILVRGKPPRHVTCCACARPLYLHEKLVAVLLLHDGEG